jgi:hypothetical protein
MLRWTIAVLFLANLLAFAAMRGMFGPLPAAGSRESVHLNQQVHPEWLGVRPETADEAADQAVVGAPAPVTPVQTQSLPQ